MVNVCWQCGDIGFSEALVYCIKCRIAARHCYCLDEVPEDLTAEINWLCEDCRIKSPNSASKAKFPTTTLLGILDHGSGISQIGPKNPCQDFGFANDHLVNSQDQHPISNVRIGSSENLDSHISYDLKKKTVSCTIGGALGTISSSAGFKLKDDGIEECGNQNTNTKILMLSDEDKFDNSQRPVDALGTNTQFSAKRLPDTFIEASDMQIIGGNLNCDINGLGAGRSSVCVGLEEGEMEESGKEKSKIGGLIIPNEDELNNFHPLINGEGTNFSFPVKRIAGTNVEPSDSQMIGRTAEYTTHESVELSAWYKQKEDEIKEYEKGKSKSRTLILPTNNFLPRIDGQSTKISFVVNRLPGTSVERSDSHTIGRTLSNDTNTLDAVRASSRLTLKEDEIEEYGNGNPKRRSIVSYKDMLDTFHPVIDGQGTNVSFAVERLVCTSIKSSDNKTSKKPSSCRTDALGTVRSSTCFEFKGVQIEEQKEKPMIRTIIPGLNQLEDIHPPIEGQGSNIKFAAKRLSGNSIEASYKQTIGSTSSCGIGAFGVVRSSACFGLKEGEIKAQAKKKRKRRRPPRKSRLIPPVKGERDNFHPVIFCQGNSIPVVAKRVTGTPVEASDRQIIGRIKTFDTLSAIRSSVCFELKKGEIYGSVKEKSESRSLILPTKDELNSLHPVIDRRGTSMNFAAKSLSGTSVEPSDIHAIRSIDTKAQIKFPCQLPSPSLPVDSHVWSGCFNINEAEIGPFGARLSRSACQKVGSLTRKLPLVLHMQKLPRLAAWPNRFKVSSPTDVNIALYFFPESDRVETVLDELVDDIINKDLVLRFEFDDVELLVFSSFVLPEEHQRFFGKYYAWGVFKPRSAKICSLPVVPHTGYQVDEAMKPKSEEEDHHNGLFKDSAQKFNDFTLQRSLIQPGKGTLRATADSTDVCEEEKLQLLHSKSSGHVELLWHREGPIGDCEKKLSHVSQGLKMSKNHTLEFKEVAKERKENANIMNSRGRLSDVDDKYTDGAERQSDLKNLDEVCDNLLERGTILQTWISKERSMTSS